MKMLPGPQFWGSRRSAAPWLDGYWTSAEYVAMLGWQVARLHAPTRGEVRVAVGQSLAVGVLAVRCGPNAPPWLNRTLR